MVFDQDNLERVAQAVIRFNPYQRNNSVESVVSHMRSIAYGSLATGDVYVATGGFMLTAFRPTYDPSQVHIRASVADHCFDLKTL
jgi:hypothetical protein